MNQNNIDTITPDDFDDFDTLDALQQLEDNFNTSNTNDNAKTNSNVLSKTNPNLNKTRKALKNQQLLKNKSQHSNQSSNQSSNQPFQIQQNDIDLLDKNNYLINIKSIQRNGRKYITTIENMPEHFFSNEDNVKHFLDEIKHIISSRATIKKNNNNEYYIEMSGNKVEIIIPIIKKYTNCSNENIVIHGVQT